MGSGILDIERRVEEAALEALKTETDLTDLLENGADSVIKRRDASIVATYPCAAVEAYNLAEYGLHTGCYLGGLRLSAMTYMEDDKSRNKVKEIRGAFLMWAQQENVVNILNDTVSAQSFSGLVTIIALQMDDNAAYINEVSMTDKINEMIQELTVVCRPSR